MTVVKWFLNGVEQSSKPLTSCTVEDNISDYMSQFTSHLPNPLGANNGVVSNNDTIDIQIYDFNLSSWTTVLHGYVSKIEEEKLLKFSGQDWTGRTYQRTISHNYEHREVSWIVRDIADRMLPECTYTNVSNTGTETEMNTQEDTDTTVTLDDTNEKYAQKFQPTQSNVIKVAIHVQNNADGKADIQLRSDDGGSPTLYDILQEESNVELEDGWNTVYITRKGLNTSKHYWIVVIWKAGSFDLSAEGNGSSGRVQYSSADPESWAGQNEDDLKYKTYYTTGKILESFKCVGKKVADAYKELADSVGDVEWIYYIDTSKDLHFKEESFASTGKQFDTTNTFTRKYAIEGKKVRNRIVVRGGESLTANATTNYKGNGTQKLFTISSGTPTSVKQVTVAGTATEDYTVNLLNNVLEFDNAPGDGDAVVIVHDKRSAIVAVAEDKTSIEENGLSIHEKQDKNIVSGDRAQEIANALLALQSDSRNSLVIEVFLDPSLSAGKTVEVKYSDLGITEYREYVISKATHRIGRGKLITRLELINQEVATMPEALKELKAIMTEIQMQQTDDDAPVVQLLTLQSEEKLTTNIEIELGMVTDSFILAHPQDNGKLGMSGGVLSHGDDQADWDSGGFSAKSENTTSEYCRTRDKSIKCEWTSTGTAHLTNEHSQGDFSTAVGVSSGTPVQGTVGLHIYLPTGSDISDVKLWIGNNLAMGVPDSYLEYEAYYNSDFPLLEGGWNYARFDLDSPSSSSGSVEWTDIDYVKIVVTKVSETGTVYFDYLTLSESNCIGVNGLGERIVRRRFIDE